MTEIIIACIVTAIPTFLVTRYIYKKKLATHVYSYLEHLEDDKREWHNTFEMAYKTGIDEGKRQARVNSLEKNNRF